MNINEIVFLIGLSANIFLLLMMVIACYSSQLQFWPPPNKHSWQYHSLWSSLRALFLCICWLLYATHSTLNVPNWLRFYIAMPIFFMAFALGSIALLQLGWRNTHGQSSEFVNSGFYKYSRNPQYVLYSISFLALALWSASISVTILLVLLSCWYLYAPFPEEKWLEQQYGEPYLRYKHHVPRYFGI